MPVKFQHVEVAALLDSGSSINILSSTLYNSIPPSCKSSIDTCNGGNVKLANDQTAKIHGTCTVKMYSQGEKYNILVYILEETSHPLILGTSYLIDNQITINFGTSQVVQNNANVRCRKRITIDPHSEVIMWGRLPKNILFGHQGMCESSRQILSKGLVASKAVVIVSKDRTVPVKLLNLGSMPVVIPKGKIIAKFSQLTDNFDVRHVKFNDQNVPIVQNVNVIPKSDPGSECKFDTEFLDNFDNNSEIDDEQKLALNQLLCDNKDIFVTKNNPSLGCTDVVQHHIILKPNMKPLHQKPYRLTPHKKEVLRHHLDELLEQGVISELSATEGAPITSPVVLVTKRSKQAPDQPLDRASSLRHFRFCVDFRYLNSQSETFKYFIPDLQELTESFTERTPNYISSIDMSSGFFQMKLSPESSKYTSFNTCFGTYKFLRVPMGLHTAPNSFQLLMDKILRKLTFQSCLCYLDDVLICSDTFQRHLSDIQEVFDRFRQAGLKLNPQKCSFAKSSVVFLGHHISKDGIGPPPDRVKALSEFPTPQNVKQLRRALGMFNWFRKYIQNYSSIAEPLTRLLKKNTNFLWTSKQEMAFKQLKTLLLNSEMLAFPRFDLPFVLAVDSSSTGIGYMLYQHNPDDPNDKVRIIRFGSKSLNTWQKSYGPTKLELLGVVTSIIDCASYLRGSKFIVECDHQALRPLFQNKLRGAIYDRWLAVLQQFNFDIKYKPAAQMQVPDALSRVENAPRLDPNAEDSLNENDPYFPYEQEEVGKISFVNSVTVNNDEQLDNGYTADTEEETIQCVSRKIRSRIDSNSIQISSVNFVNRDANRGVDSNSMKFELVQDSTKLNKAENGGIGCNFIQFDDNEQNILIIDGPVNCDVPILEPNSEKLCHGIPIDLCGNDSISTSFCNNVCSDDSGNLNSEPDVKVELASFFGNEAKCENDESLNLNDFGRNDCISTTNLPKSESVDTTQNLIDVSHVSRNDRISTHLPSDTRGMQDLMDFGGNDSISIAKCEIQPTDEFQFVCAAAGLDDSNHQVEFSKENINCLQRLDENLLPIIQYLENGILPKLQKEARSLLLKIPDYCILDGLLFHSRKAKSKRTRTMGEFQLVIPKALIPKILELFHDSPLAGHMGIQQTADAISEHFYFQNLPSTVSDFVRTCHDCQERKMTKAHTKSKIISYRTPSEPFQTWQVDLFGPLPITQTANTYIFTAVDMFSKFLYTVPLLNSDSITVSSAIFQLVCTFGVCNCIISDRGSEFISQCTDHLCKVLDIQQNFTPSYIHHCLGLCERTHRTLAERLTPYVKKGTQWDTILPAITFSFNISPNDSTKYSPYEVVYGFRPKFPLSASKLGIDLTTLHVDYHSYMTQQIDQLTIIRDAACDNAEAAKKVMTERKNKSANPLNISAGDFVYMLKDGVGPGRKLQPKYAGPFVVDEILSPHLVKLKDRETGKPFKNPVHLDRLKIAFVRAPNPGNYFIPSNGPANHDQTNDAETDNLAPETRPEQTTDNELHEPVRLPRTRPKRQVRKPVRYRDSSNSDDKLFYQSTIDSSTDDTYYKVKRILAQRTRDGKRQYLVHYKGEPAQNAIWTVLDQLNEAAKEAVTRRPPPTVD